MLTLKRKKTETAPEDAWIQDEVSPNEVEDQAAATTADTGHAWTNGERFKTLAATGLALASCAAGPLALGAHVLGGTPETQTAAVEVQDPAQSQRVSEFGTAFVTQYLTAARGQEDQITGMLARGAARNFTLPETAPQIGAAAPGEAVQTGASTWVVTVGVDQPNGPDGATVRRYWQVPVVTDTSGAIAAGSTPSLISTPTAGDLEVDLGDNVSDKNVEDTVSAFIQAYLVGQGEVAPLLAPGTSVTAVTPTAFTEVSVSSITTTQEIPKSPSEGDLVRIQVSVSATAVDGGNTRLGYSLDLRYRDRWEVAAINPTTASPTPTGENS